MKNNIYFLTLFLAGIEVCSAQFVVNGSFEIGPTPPFGGITVQSPDSTTIPGWTITGGNVDYVGSDTWQAADGIRSLDMNGQQAGTMMQNVNGFTVGQEYSLSFDMGSHYSEFTFLTVDIDSLTQVFSFDGIGNTEANIGWSPRTMDFTATSTMLPLTFYSLNPGDAGATLDNISIVPVPEPCATSLLCTAAVLGFVRRMRLPSASRTSR